MSARRSGAAALVLGGGVRTAQALTACTAADIIAQEVGCPDGSGPCTITKDYDVASGCILDFGTRDVTIASSSLIDIDSGIFTLKAGNLIMRPGAFIDARGDQAGNIGGFFTIDVAHDFVLGHTVNNPARIDVSARTSAGSIDIIAGGDIIFMGRINADNLTAFAGGGSLRAIAGGNITAPAGATISLDGGEVDMQAGGFIDIDVGISMVGADGGTADFGANGYVSLGAVTGNGSGEAGSGGTLNVLAGTSVELLGELKLNGTGELINGGGDGGSMSIEAEFGDITISGPINVDGGGPDGPGGEILLAALGEISAAATAAASTSRPATCRRMRVVGC